MSAATFAELGIPGELVEVLDRRLITEPFDIQTLAIPDALLGRDILGRAPTGSGKTLAFGLPMLARLERGTKKQPRGLILSPTRELAEQICRELEPLAKAADRKVLAVYGGVGLDRQIRALRKGVDVLVACPGRLLDLINQKAVRLDQVDIVVVDEADRMADMGFLPDVRKLLDQTNEDRQTVLFSATLDKDVQVLIDKYQEDPVVHEVGEVEPDLSIVDHRFIKVKKSDRIWLAADLIAEAGPTVVFVRTRHGVDRLARQLKQEGIKAGYIHGGRSQSQRDRALKVFIDGKVDALVATDVAARGIHVDGVACVIHYDPPADIKDYVHRSGRTARAGAEGVVVSFLDGPQVKESQKMQRKLSLEADIESPPARRPRSSRPASVDDRETAADRNGSSKRTGGTRGGGARNGRSRSDSKPRSDAKPQSRSNAKSRSGSTSRSDTAAAQSPSSAAKTNGGARRSKRSGAGSSGSGSTSRPSPARSGSARSGSGATSRPSSARSGSARSGAGAKRSTPRPGSKPGSKSGARSTSNGASKKRSTKQTTARSKPAEARGAGASRPKRAAAASKRVVTGGKRSVRANQKAAGSKPASKRSGKPRPKNRKNKPKSGRK